MNWYVVDIWLRDANPLAPSDQTLSIQADGLIVAIASALRRLPDALKIVAVEDPRGEPA